MDIAAAFPLPLPPAPSDAEIDGRLMRLRAEMSRDSVGFLVLTSRQNIEYVTAYQSFSFAYNARPVLGILTHDDVIIVGSTAERRNIEQRQRRFGSVYYSGYLAEAAQAVVAAIEAKDPGTRETVAIDYGQDNFGRGSLELVDGLRARGAQARLVAGADLIWRVRMIKSPFEAELKRSSFRIVNSAFDEAIAAAHLGISECELQRDIQSRIILKGAERADPIAMLFAKGDFVYSRPPTDRRLEPGHYIWTDFRSTYGGYPADRNRIARAGAPQAWEVDCYRKVRNLTIELCRAIKPGMTGGDVYRQFEALWTQADLGPVYGLASRIGHGGGVEVTEPPSIAASSNEVLHEGMILHLEPKLERDGAVFQFEEVVFLRSDGVDFLSDLSPESCPIVM
jgi:Xaa-Pro dipeptidase